MIFLVFLPFYLLLYADTVFGPNTLIAGDIFPVYGPMWSFAAAAVRQGILPLWNPHNSFGTPFLANPQTCLLYPPALIFQLAGFTRMLNLYIVLHLVLASSFTFAWMRDCGASRRASALSGFAFGLGGYMTSTIGGTIAMAAASWFPLVLLFFRRALRPGIRWKALAGGALALQYLAGDPAPCFLSFFLFSLIVAFKSAEKSLRAARPAAQGAGALLTVAAVFAGLTLFQTPLFAEFISLSDRLHAPLGERMSNSLAPGDLWALVVPNFYRVQAALHDAWSYQSWLQEPFAGVGVLCLAAVAVGRWRERNIRLLGALALLGVLLALGRYSPVYRFFYHYFPFFDFFRYPVRFMFPFYFAAACLAGHGFDRLEKAPAPGRRIAAAGLFLVTGLAVWAVFRFPAIREAAAVWVPARQAAEVVARNAVQSLLMLAAVGLALFAAAYSRLRRAALVALFLLTVLDLLRTSAALPRVGRAVFEEPFENIRVMMADHGTFRSAVSPLQAKRIDEYVGTDSAAIIRDHRRMLAPGTMLYFGIDEIFGYDSLYVREAKAVRTGMFDLTHAGQGRFWDLLNVRYLASPVPELGDPFQAVSRTPEANLFLSRTVLPRAFFVEEARVLPPAAILPRLTGADFDPEKTVYLEQPAAAPQRTARDSSVVRSLIYENPNRVTMLVHAGKKPWLFFSDTYYPGWRLHVDGIPHKIYRANHAFRAAIVEPGDHRLVWSYDPPLFKIGAAVSLATLAFVIAAAVRRA